MNTAGRAESTRDQSDPIVLCDRVRDALARRSDAALEIAEDAVRTCPGEFELLLLAALAALAVGQSVRAQVFLKRHQKRYVPGKAVSLLTALAFAQQRQFSRAWAMLCAEGIDTFPAAARWFVGVDVMSQWLSERLLEIRLECGVVAGVARVAKKRRQRGCGGRVSACYRAGVGVVSLPPANFRQLGRLAVPTPSRPISLRYRCRYGVTAAWGVPPQTWHG